MRAVPILISVLSLLLISIYHPYFSPLFAYYSSREKMRLESKIIAMKKLVESPGIGLFFYTQLVEELALQQKWDQVLNYSIDAIQSPLHRNSFAIWYYKATSQCLLHKLQDCEDSARVANGLSSIYTEVHVHEIFKLSELLKTGEAVVTKSKYNEILVTMKKQRDPQGMDGEATENPEGQQEAQTGKQKQYEVKLESL